MCSLDHDIKGTNTPYLDKEKDLSSATWISTKVCCLRCLLRIHRTTAGSNKPAGQPGFDRASGTPKDQIPDVPDRAEDRPRIERCQWWKSRNATNCLKTGEGGASSISDTAIYRLLPVVSGGGREVLRTGYTKVDWHSPNFQGRRTRKCSKSVRSNETKSDIRSLQKCGGDLT